MKIGREHIQVAEQTLGGISKHTHTQKEGMGYICISLVLLLVLRIMSYKKKTK